MVINFIARSCIIDALVPRRGFDSGNNVTERVVNAMLSEMDGLEELHDVVIIGTTNRPDLIDPALLRPGRFDRIIAITVPEEASREKIFAIHTKTMPLDKDVEIKVLVEKTQGYVGADIEAVCREAGILALRENMDATIIKMKHFEQAIDKVPPSLEEEEMKRYQEVEESYLKRARTGGIKSMVPPNYLG